MSFPEPSGMHWGVRQSFREYVDAVPDSTLTLDGGTTLDERARLVFPRDQCGDDTGPRVLKFRGSAFFVAYAGVLTVRIRDPWLEFDAEGEGGELTVQHPGYREETDIRTAVARFTTTQRTGSSLLITDPVVTPAGVRMLGDVYEIGAVLDSVEVLSGATTTAPR